MVLSLSFFFLVIHLKTLPEIKDIYPGIKGKTHGDKKLINPAPNAIDNSNIYKLFSYYFYSLSTLDYLLIIPSYHHL